MRTINLLIASIISTFMIIGCNPEKSDNNPVNISSQVSLNKNNEEHINKGTVEAILNAFSTGGLVVLDRADSNARFFSPFGEGELDQRATIRPRDQWNGAHLRADDWHVILLGLFSGGDNSYTLKNAIEDISTTKITFTLNGEVIETEQTPIKRFLSPSYLFDVAYGYQVGKIYSPDELPVGTYTLNLLIETPGYEDLTNSIVFYVDPN